MGERTKRPDSRCWEKSFLGFGRPGCRVEGRGRASGEVEEGVSKLGVIGVARSLSLIPARLAAAAGAALWRACCLSTGLHGGQARKENSLGESSGHSADILTSSRDGGALVGLMSGQGAERRASAPGPRRAVWWRPLPGPGRGSGDGVRAGHARSPALNDAPPPRLQTVPINAFIAGPSWYRDALAQGCPSRTLRRQCANVACIHPGSSARGEVCCTWWQV